MELSPFAMRSITFFALFFAIFQLGYADEVGIKTPTLPEETSAGEIGKKPLLHTQSAGNVNRMGGRRCSERDISIFQETSASLPNGIPQYTVQILNTCASGCRISNIHAKCGWFSSARLINPRVFKRIKYDDCLVNNGEPLPFGRVLTFQYATTFKQPLSVSRVSCG